MSVLLIHVHDACLSPYCMSIFILHVQVHAVCPYPCCISFLMLHVHVHAVCSCQCCMSILLIHAAFPCCVPMLHFHVSMLHVSAACWCCIPILHFRCKSVLYIILHAHTPHMHAACPICMSMLHVFAACPCCMHKNITMENIFLRCTNGNVHVYICVPQKSSNFFREAVFCFLKQAKFGKTIVLFPFYSYFARIFFVKNGNPSYPSHFFYFMNLYKTQFSIFLFRKNKQNFWKCCSFLIVSLFHKIIFHSKNENFILKFRRIPLNQPYSDYGLFCIRLRTREERLFHPNGSIFGSVWYNGDGTHFRLSRMVENSFNNFNSLSFLIRPLNNQRWALML
jgi:hypothetical protein